MIKNGKGDEVLCLLLFTFLISRVCSCQGWGHGFSAGYTLSGPIKAPKLEFEHNDASSFSHQHLLFCMKGAG